MRKKGSALVFSVLMLAFFLALSLNIYFLARKKGERAGVKVAGERTTNNIDMASSIGYQELQLAEKFVREGFPYISDHPYEEDEYNLVNGSHFYVNLTTGKYSNNYTGVQVNNFIDYFSSTWNYGTGASPKQKQIIGEEISNNKVVSRMWHSVGVDSRAIPLWAIPPTSPERSIGGYSYKGSELPDASSLTSASATYEKFILLDTFTKDGIKVSSSAFVITIKETFDYTKSSTGGDLTFTVSNRNLTTDEGFTVKAINLE